MVGSKGSGYFEHERLVAYRRARDVLQGLAQQKEAFAGSGWLYTQAIRAAGIRIVVDQQEPSIHVELQIEGIPKPGGHF